MRLYRYEKSLTEIPETGAYAEDFSFLFVWHGGGIAGGLC